MYHRKDGNKWVVCYVLLSKHHVFAKTVVARRYTFVALSTLVS